MQVRAWGDSGERADGGALFKGSGWSSASRLGVWAKVLTIAALAVGLPVLLGALGVGEWLRGLVEHSGAWAPLVYIAAKAASTVVAPLSGVPLKAASGALFGFVGGLSYSVLGDVLGGCICFLASRYLGRDVARRPWRDKRVARTGGVLGRGVGGWQELLFCRITFPAIYNILSCAAGSTRLPFWQYLTVTTFGGIFHTGILVTIGTSATLGWEARLTAYAGIVGLAGLALVGGRYVRGALERWGAGRIGETHGAAGRGDRTVRDPLHEGKTYVA